MEILNLKGYWKLPQGVAQKKGYAKVVDYFVLY